MITTSQASFPLSDINDLPHLVSEDVSLQLLRLVEQTVRAKVSSEHQVSVYLDELQGVVATPLGDIM